MSERKLNILFGFSDDNFEAAVKQLLRSKDCDAQIYARFSKESVKSYIEKHPDTDAVVLLETFPKVKGSVKSEKYTAEEIVQLTENSDVNIILVLSENHKGSDYMSTLFAAGVTSAFFQKPGSGARPRDIASLILRKRTRKAAREYYGITATKIEIGVLESADFNVLYEQLQETEERSMLENYLTVCKKLSPQQIADFTRRLPNDDKSYLSQFEEFHTVMQLLKKVGFDMKIKKPKKVMVGLRNTVGISLKEESIVIDAPQKEVVEEPVKKKKKFLGAGKKEKTHEESITEKKTTEEPKTVSMQELFAGEDAEDAETEEIEGMEAEEVEVSVEVSSMSDFFADTQDDSDDEEEDEEDYETVYSEAEQEQNEDSGDAAAGDTEEVFSDKTVNEASPKEALREQKKVNVMPSYSEEEEEEEEEEISFDDVESLYDNLVLSTGSRFKLPYLIAIIGFVALLVVLCVLGSNNGTVVF